MSYVQLCETLKCYSCSGGQECGKLFSPKSKNIEIVEILEKNTISSCSISVTPEGLTTRSIISSYKCRSSSYEFCCNEDLCNNLPSPPLPALTSLKCAIGQCTRSNGICIYDAIRVTVLSSATESCSVTFGKEEYKYYKKGCQPTVMQAYTSGRKYPSIDEKKHSSNTQSIFCCNSPECNTGHIENAIKGAAIQCYTCDSRITGLAGCMIFNESSPYVYKAGSSIGKESCATIIGAEGRDAITGVAYPAFAIRTFIPKCVNQPLGRVAYGGAYFTGRIECCSTPFCNTQNLKLTKDKTKIKLKKKSIFIIIAVVVVIILLILISAIVGWAIYQCYKKKDKKKYDPCRTSEPPISIESLKTNIKKQSSPQVTVGPYPERHADI